MVTQVSAIAAQDCTCLNKLYVDDRDWEKQGRHGKGRHGRVVMVGSSWQGCHGWVAMVGSSWQGCHGRVIMVGSSASWQGCHGRFVMVGSSWQGRHGKVVMVGPGKGQSSYTELSFCGSWGPVSISYFSVVFMLYQLTMFVIEMSGGKSNIWLTNYVFHTHY